jgi:hypothetical protein
MIAKLRTLSPAGERHQTAIGESNGAGLVAVAAFVGAHTSDILSL